MDIAWDWGFVEDGSASLQVSFAANQAVAFTSLSQGSGGLGLIGISQYETLPDPNGPPITVNEPFATANVIEWGYPPLAWDMAMTTVTATMLTGGGGDQITGTLVVFVWG